MTHSGAGALPPLGPPPARPPLPPLVAPAPEPGRQAGADGVDRAGRPRAGWLRDPRRLVRGRAGDPAWVRPAVLVLLLGTALLYLVGLSASGWANDFYSAAAQAGASSWKAFFYGASDAAGSITVDKPPLSIWAMALPVRIFGLSSWSILVPQALMGVATVGVLYATVRRWFSPGAALLAGAVMALTPVAVLMFRFNNPDALLVLLLTCAAYAVVRALEGASTRWLVLAGALVGLGFMTKMLQALVVLPPFALAYGLAAPTSAWRRVRQIALSGAAVVAAGGLWVAIVELVPASARPYIGGSQHNSILELIFGYNGFGRLTGNETGSVGGGGPAGGPGGGGMWGPTGWDRLFNTQWGGGIAWLLPAALALAAVGLWLTLRRPRTDRQRAAFIIWGGWLVVTAAVFSFGKGIIHEYYAVALAPAIGALVGMGAQLLWTRRAAIAARAAMAAITVGSAILAYVLLGRSDWQPWLRPVTLVAGIAGAALLLAPRAMGRRVSIAAATIALVALLAGPAAYSVQTAATPHHGAIPTAGPDVRGGGPGGMRLRGGPGGFRGRFPAGGIPGQGPGTFPGQAPAGVPGQGPAGGRGGPGGLLDGSTPPPELVAALEQDASRYEWVAAAVGSNSAAGYQLATQRSVMPIGGFNGSDPSPTLEQFQSYVAQGKIHFFIGGGRGFGRSMGGSDVSSQISAWVQANFTARTVGGVTLYDLTAPVTP
jgi:4-amino-4-deoxy-L-arabinose transferase-like glycosyltransferase